MRTSSSITSITVMLLVLAAAGCAGPLGRPQPEETLRAGGAFTIVEDLDVPPAAGGEGCGAQALATAIARVDDGVDPHALAQELPWHDAGATPVDLLAAARSRGFEAALSRGTWEALGEAVQRRTPAIVMLDVASRGAQPVMHWVLVSGVARDESALLLAAPHRCHHVVAREMFLPRWEASDRCMITVGNTHPLDR